MLQRQQMKNGKAPTSQEKKKAEKEEKGNKAIARKKVDPKKEGKKKKENSATQKAAKMDEKKKTILRKKFFDAMLEAAPEFCMETGQRLIIPAGHNPRSIVCHILPKRKVDLGGVPSVQFDPLNVVYLCKEIHDKMDADLGSKSTGEYVRSMKIFPLLKERVGELWNLIPANERVNITSFLKPE